MMQRSLIAGLILGVSLMAAGGPVHAQAPLVVSVMVDEDGNGTITYSNGFSSPLPFAMLPDPGPGGLSSVATYGLGNPTGLVAGDLLISDEVDGPILDVVRFNPDQNGGSLVFYSDDSDGADSLADTPSPPSDFYANTLFLTESGPEGGPNGLVYTPTAGQPGFIAGASAPVTYRIMSDSAPPTIVPEPSTIALGLTGSVVGVVLASRRRRVSRA